MSRMDDFDPSQDVDRRIGAVAAILGAIMLFVGTWLHPMSADPNDPVAAFTEYAADRIWVASHLTQFAGFAMIGVALLALGRTLGGEPRAEVCVTIGAAGVATSVAVAAVLQAVDGVALKTMVDTWAAASAERKEAVFAAAFAVRQIEIGTASLFCLVLGLTTVCYGAALLSSDGYPRWLGALAFPGAAGLVAAGIAQAYTGFSSTAMALSMPASLALLGWMIAAGICMWRRKEDS